VLKNTQSKGTMMEANIIKLSKKAEKSLLKIPQNILYNFLTWKGQIEENGIESVRKILAYNDEKLKGSLNGFRSVRLNNAYRVIYTEHDNYLKIIFVEDVTKHDYKKIRRMLG
jgi:proteic killer suppression protein